MSIIFFGAGVNPRWVVRKKKPSEERNDPLSLETKRGKPRKVQPTSNEDDKDSNIQIVKLLNVMFMYMYVHIYICLYIYVHDTPLIIDQFLCI